MKCTVVGKSISSFVSRTTGEIIDNSKLFVTCSFPKVTFGDTQNSGLRCIEVKTPSDDIVDVKVNEVVEIDFDDKGRYEGLERFNVPDTAKK